MHKQCHKCWQLCNMQFTYSIKYQSHLHITYSIIYEYKCWYVLIKFKYMNNRNNILVFVVVVCSASLIVKEWQHFSGYNQWIYTCWHLVIRIKRLYDFHMRTLLSTIHYPDILGVGQKAYVYHASILTLDKTLLYHDSTAQHEIMLFDKCVTTPPPHVITKFEALQVRNLL